MIGKETTTNDAIDTYHHVNAFFDQQGYGSCKAYMIYRKCDANLRWKSMFFRKLAWQDLFQIWH